METSRLQFVIEACTSHPSLLSLLCGTDPSNFRNLLSRSEQTYQTTQTCTDEETAHHLTKLKSMLNRLRPPRSCLDFRILGLRTDQSDSAAKRCLFCNDDEARSPTSSTAAQLHRPWVFKGTTMCICKHLPHTAHTTTTNHYGRE